MNRPTFQRPAWRACVLSLTLGGLALPAGAETTDLARIVVTGAEAGASVKGTSDSQLDGDAIAVEAAGDLDTALRGKPGTYTKTAADQPGVTVNIRGLQGAGRVNAMIDGVPQNVRNLSGHAGTLNTMVYVDPGLLAGVDIARGTVAGAAGMGTLGGAANFRTLDVGDVLREGHASGALLRFGTGTNGKDWTLTSAVAQRLQFGEATVGLMAAVSGFEEQPYEDGHGKPANATDGQRPASYLLKGEYETPDFGKLKLTALRYENAFSAPISSGYVWDVETETVALNYARDALRLNAWWTRNDIRFPTNSSGTGGTYRNREGVDTGTGLDLSNGAEIDLGGRPVSLTYGLAWSRDSYDGNAKSGANGDGSLTKAGAFLEARTEWDRVSLSGGLRYDHWKTQGVTDYLADGTPVDTDSRSGGRWNPSLRLDYRATPALGFFGALSQTMRPPTASEMFYPGAVFAHSDVTSTAINNNPDLVPEEAINVELGMTYAQGPFTAQASVFRNRIDNYIGYSTDPSDGNLRWVNLDGDTIMQGVEFEGRYDTGRLFAGLSLTVADTDKPLTTTPGMISDTGTLPDDYATLDLGMRWRDQTVTTGMRVRYTGAAEVYTGSAVPVAIAENALLDLYASWKVRDGFELYANIENVTDAWYQTANAAFTETTGNLGGRGRTLTIGGSLRF